MQIRIRRARPTDTARIAEIHVKASQAAFEGLIPPAEIDGLCVHEMARRWAPLTLLHGGFFVAEDDEPRGFCLVTRGRAEPPGSPTAELMALYVDPDRQSQGIGTQLMDAALRHAANRRFTELMLWVLPGNRRACRFYESFGFDTDQVSRLDHGLRTAAPHLQYRLSLGTACARVQRLPAGRPLTGTGGQHRHRL